MNEGQSRASSRLTRAQARDRTRALLVEAAARVFARKGYAAASVEEIAEAAGYSIGAVYSNFGSKEELFLTLMAERASGRIGEVVEILDRGARAEEGPGEALGRFLTEVADKDADWAPLQAEFWLYAVRNPALMAGWAEQSRTSGAALAEVVRGELERHGSSGQVPADAIATAVFALFQGLVVLRRTDPVSVPEELFGQVLHWLFAGAAATATPSDPAAAPAAGRS